MLGKKPFPRIKNSDVIGLIECGERLPKPSRCPEQIYQMLHKCWRYEPDRRPTFRYIKRRIFDVYQEELGVIGAIARMDLNNDNTTHSSSVSTLSSSLSGYNDRTLSSSSSASLTRHKPSNKIVANKFEVPFWCNSLIGFFSSNRLFIFRFCHVMLVKAVFWIHKK